EMNGANVQLVDGLISDCGKLVGSLKSENGWFELSTLKEPYRLEGKKTLGYELAEQRGWTLPDVILYPTGGGTGLIGMWKAFDEMEALGWIGSKRPRMVSVQAENCAPMVRAFHRGDTKAEPWIGASTIAAGLRVPGGVGDAMILSALRDSGGTGVTVSDEELLENSRLMGRTEGLFVCPEGGAALAGLRKLIAQDWIQPDEEVVLFNTGSGLKYLDAFSN
ncbi:MAG: threonine synthase, partial [Armatimonadota bacterium]